VLSTVAESPHLAAVRVTAWDKDNREMIVDVTTWRIE
jgi:hypothetical protein